MRAKRVMAVTRMATVREGTSMPQSFKYAGRWLTGASAAAMLIASIPAAANAQNTQIITLCAGQTGKAVAVIHKNRGPKQLNMTRKHPRPAVVNESLGN